MINTIEVSPIETRTFLVGEDLVSFLREAVPAAQVREKMVLAITSKIVSLAESRLVSAEQDKLSLVKREADLFLGHGGHNIALTIKHGMFIASAGIDESNSPSGEYILYPENPYESARSIWSSLRRSWGIRDLGVILTDSHTTPLRRGVTGIALSFWGFNPIRDLVGTEDLFGRKLKVTKMNLVDGLAATAVLVMGEGRERRPLCAIHGAALEFVEQNENWAKEIEIPLEEDLYSPLLTSLKSTK